MHVENTGEKLLEVVFADGSRETTRVCNVIEELATVYELLHDVGHFLRLSILLQKSRLIFEFV